jgi:orotidine-5'-phosphate decarboxylase
MGKNKNSDDTAKRLRDIPLRQRIITALDVAGGDAAVTLARKLGPRGLFVKVGLELFSAAGPTVVRQLQECGKEVFLDLKYHDIPNTVAGAARVASILSATLVTVHAAAGRRALSAAAEALHQTDNQTRPALLAVTMLTSLSEADWEEVAPGPENLQQRVLRLAHLALDSGCDGIVCAAADLNFVRAEIGPEPLVVTPGIRAATATADDQRRIATPAAAAAAGADFLVIGRPITRAADPQTALLEICRELPE